MLERSLRSTLPRIQGQSSVVPVRVLARRCMPGLEEPQSAPPGRDAHILQDDPRSKCEHLTMDSDHALFRDCIPGRPVLEAPRWLTP